MRESGLTEVVGQGSPTQTEKIYFVNVTGLY